MADPTSSGPSGPVVGEVTVKVSAPLDEYTRNLQQAKAQAQQFDQAASRSMKSLEEATKGLTATQAKLVKSLIDQGVSAKDAAKQLGATSEAVKALASYEAQLAKTANEVNSAHANMNGAVKEAEKGAKAASSAFDKSQISMSLVTREAIVMTRELARGNFSRLGGSATILAQGLGLLTPAMIGVTAAVAGVVGAIAAAEVATLQYEAAQRKLLGTLAGSAAASGQSIQAMNASADAAMRASTMSIQGARSATEAFAAAGVNQQQTITVLAASVSTYAALTGEKAANAQKELAQAMEDPARGAETLHNKIGILDQTTIEHIRNLQAMGDKEGAVNELTKALAQRIEQAQEAGVGLGGAFTNLTKGAGYLWEQLGKVNGQLQMFAQFGFAAPGIEARQQAQMDAALARIQRQAQLNRALTDPAAQAALENTPEFRDQRARQDLLNQQAALSRRAAAEQQTGRSSEYAKDAAALKDINRALQSFVPEAQKAHQIAELDAKIAATKDAHLKSQLTTQRELLKLSGQVMSPEEAAQRAADAGRIAGARVHGPTDRSQSAMALRDQETRGLLATSAAYLESDQAALRAAASAKTYTDALKEHATAGERARMVQSELNNELAKAAETAAKEVAQSRGQLAAEKAANDAVAAGTMSREQANETLKEQEKLRPILAAYDVADAATKRALKPVIDALTASYKALNAEQTRTKEIDIAQADKDEIEVLKLRLSLVNATKQAQDQAVARLQAQQAVRRAGGDPTQGAGLAAVDASVQRGQLQGQLAEAQAWKKIEDSVRQETTALEKQGATMGMTLIQADKYNELQKLLNEAKKDGITLDEQQRAALDKLAGAYAQASDAARKLKESQDAAKQASDALSSSVTGALEGIIFDGKSASATMHDLAKSLGKQAFEGVMTGTGPFAGILGTANAKTVGGSNGGVLSQLFGGLLGVGKDGKGPTGTPNDPIYVTSSAAGGLGSLIGGGGSGGKGGGILGSIMGLFGKGASSAGATDSLGMMADLLHSGTEYVGSPAPKVRVNPSLFLSAPRFHTGLAPDEFPAILQTGEKVIPRGGSAVGSRTTIVNMNIHGVSDTGSFNRSTYQLTHRMKRAIA